MTSDDGGPRADLADRYQEMVQLQISSLSNFDEKAWRAARVIGIILGVSITALSIILKQQSGLSSANSTGLVSLALGIGGIVLALGFAVVSYLSTLFGFGPSVEIGEEICDKEIDVDEYESTVLSGYVDTINKNNRVLKAKSRRFRYTLTSMLSGIIFIAVGFLLLILNPSTCVSAIIFVVSGAIVLASAYYILTKQYTALNGGESDE